MDEIKKFFESNIFEFLPILIGIYVILYVLKVDLHLIITGIIFIVYFYYRYNFRETEKNNIIISKHPETFQNKLPSIINKYNDIIDFLYYIHDFNQYNNQVYNDLLININDFLTLIEDYTILDNDYKKKYYTDIIIDTKYKILDDLSSFIYSFNNSPILKNKLNNSIEKMNIILSNYIKKLNIKEDDIVGANNYL
jgi:hypothetical protein